MFVATPFQPFSPAQPDASRVAPAEADLELRDDGWDATGVLVFATSLLTLGGSGLVLLLRVAGVLG